jgi:hypothetical protein
MLVLVAWRENADVYNKYLLLLEEDTDEQAGSKQEKYVVTNEVLWALKRIVPLRQGVLGECQ